MKQYIKDGKIKTRNQIVIKGQRTIKDKDGNEKVVSTNTFNPSEELLFADGWVEYVPAPVEPYKPTYEERVEQLIRECYSLNQELAIQRQRDTKEEEFNTYYEYCEECKLKAKQEECSGYGGCV